MKYQLGIFAAKYLMVHRHQELVLVTMSRLTPSNESSNGVFRATYDSPRATDWGTRVVATHGRAGSGSRRVLRDGDRDRACRVPAAVSIPGVPRSDLDGCAGFPGADAVGLHPVHRAGRIHPEHS